MNITASPEFDGMPLDTETIPQECLNIHNKERTNPFPWNGQFSPQLIEVLLRTYANRECFVLDPFLGSGTVLHEAGRLGFPAFGSEVNPAPCKMAQVYRLINLVPDARRQLLEELSQTVQDWVLAGSALFSSTRKTCRASLKQVLAEEANRTNEGYRKALLEALVVLLNYGEKELTAEAVLSEWSKLCQTVLALPFSHAPIDLANCDARSLPLRDACADMIITSPPYINVFNYHQHYRRSVEALGWDLLQVARSEIGSNRKHRGNRFLTVIQYALDMAAVLGELRRVSRPDARVILVVGRESNVRKTRFFNGELVARLAIHAVGYRLTTRQERVFQNRFGEMIYEDILHLTHQPPGTQLPAVEIAREALNAALDRAPPEALADLKDALEKSGEVKPSPMYRQESTFPGEPCQNRKEVM
jgi:hypothetical protein